MNNHNAIKQFDTHCALGESPLWHKSTSTLFWLDIEKQQLFSYQSGQAVQQITLNAKVSFIAETNDPELLIGLADFGIVLININSHKIDCVQNFPDYEGSSNRANDGGISPKGQLFFGTMDNEAKNNNGSLYAFDGTLQCLESNVLVPNLFAFIDDNNFFFADSLNNQIEHCTLDQSTIENGFLDNALLEKLSIENDAINNKKLTRKHWVSTPEGVFPDGGCLDKQGGLWSAQWGASQVVRYSLQDKAITDIIHLPELQVTSCCFIGENLDQLFITTAAEGLQSSQFGHCYICELPFNGHPYIILIHHF
ncbi:SMP-30/gluconolactonase/LRE family protein [Colwellia sp. MSW7]|uniref:SMP-30/gluconolactonase/LRE family protein n=1 Tax=Colwellia maritima TaxID=2912588 RepID=A0ABS9X570_9GAMM|nr:SMP-30/gluconolactonase/LRE family protein [Colwellia maritima]MCI2285374.1 SMP-30/gluconolactonase/LRE family protein [Colwellia maritima]